MNLYIYLVGITRRHHFYLIYIMGRLSETVRRLNETLKHLDERHNSASASVPNRGAL